MNDLYKILESLDRIEEGGVTPVGVKHGLNPQQKSVKQMPALFKMKSQGPVLGGEIKDAPSKGYFVGGESEEAPKFNRSGNNKLRDKEDYLDKRDLLFRMLTQQNLDAETKSAVKDRLAQLEKAAHMAGFVSEAGTSVDGVSPDTKQILEDDDDNPMKSAVTRRIMIAHPEWITRYGIEVLVDCIDDATDFWEGEEIGTSDVSAYVHRVKDLLDRRADRTDEGLTEAQATEDVLSTVKKKLGDYLQDIATQIKTDPDLKDKIPQEIDKISPSVKTITTDDGHEIKIHGNEDDGFRITIKNKEAKTKFDSLDEAVMACEMYCNRRRAHRETQINDDYLEER